MSVVGHLLVLADAYGRAARVSPTTVSYRAFKDSKKLRMLREGASITVRRAEKVTQWFWDNWPEGSLWPSDFPRPLQDKAA